MSQYVVSPPPVAAIPVRGTSATFPLRRVYCVGRNYVEHIREMGNDERNPPIFFQKPADALVLDGGEVPYPSQTKDFQHEVELVVALKSGGTDIAPENALGHVFGYAVGLDMTRRDLQSRTGKPWEIAKAFDHSFPCGEIATAEEVGHVEKGAIELKVNGETRQSSDVDLLIWRLPEIIANLSTLFELKAGDVILTGTPHGVGPVERGDRLEASVAGLPGLTVTIV
ncbi:fumarylacetoacetate hydrolase family protein [Aureimonas mangrovi]|uniref:fumarylacetoacetate hydrolase family protein n=1 Tax=Aureimonas mangrovi TaxID=2758041 RepID=UPI00163D7945|nr:fumarylacetoacetate hydrolase family protein [Aureimonas mangrovi]